jgi:hypothetical protein
MHDFRGERPLLWSSYLPNYSPGEHLIVVETSTYMAWGNLWMDGELEYRNHSSLGYIMSLNGQGGVYGHAARRSGSC